MLVLRTPITVTSVTMPVRQLSISCIQYRDLSLKHKKIHKAFSSGKRYINSFYASEALLLSFVFYNCSQNQPPRIELTNMKYMIRLRVPRMCMWIVNEDDNPVIVSWEPSTVD